MLLKRKIIQISLAAAIFIFGNLFFASSALAVPPEDPNAGTLIVNFNPNPLFNASNFLPGDAKTGEAEVINNTGEIKRIAAEAINYPKDLFGNVPGKDLSRALTIVIREKNGGDLYGGSSPTGAKTLFDFYKNGETYLSDVSGSGGTKTYQFEISFPENKGDEWQETATRFDIIVGFQGEEGGVKYCNNNGTADNGETGIDCGGGGCSGCGGEGESGGGGGLPQGLIIQYEDAIEITGTTATIKWFTNYKATSQVVYCEESENCVFDFSDNAGNPPLYGYKHTTAETHTPANPNGVTYREIELTGLKENTTYNFRCISHASPPTVSRKHNFTTLAMSDNDGNNNGEVKGESTYLPVSGSEDNETGFVALSNSEIKSGDSEGDTTNEDNMKDGTVLGVSSYPDSVEENAENNNPPAETGNDQNEYDDVTQKNFLDYSLTWFALILLLIIIGLILYIIKLKKNRKKSV